MREGGEGEAEGGCRSAGDCQDARSLTDLRFLTVAAAATAAGTLHTEYLEDELEDSVLQAILHRCYSLFSLFNSSFTSIVSASSHDALRCKLQLFMSYFLPTIRFSQLIYFTDIHGFQFLPVDKITFLTIQYIIHLLTLNFHPPGSGGSGGAAGTNPLHAATGGGLIKNCALMYNSKLIYSGLNSEMMFLLYSLDQDLMYFFLVDYLTLKENLHLDIRRYVAAQGARDAARKAASADGGEAGAGPTHRPWATPGPEPIPGLYNVPESVYERNGRIATNRKAWDRAQNKGEVSADEEFPEEPELAEDAGGDAHQPSLQRLQGGAGALADEDDLDQGAGRRDSRSRSGSNASATAANAPFGYMTGPYRVSNMAGAVGVGAAGAAASVPSAAGVQTSNFAPCINSPLIYLDGIEPAAGSSGCSGVKAGPFGSGNPGVEANNPAFGAFPSAAAGGAAGSDPNAPSKPLRLVVYQKYKITLFLIVEDQEDSSSSASAASAAAAGAKKTSPSASGDALAAQLGALSLSGGSDGCSSPQPALSFYSSLESFIESNLKKLGEMLHEQTVRLHGASGSGVAEEPYRFLYFNHMNLALKTSLSSSAPSGGGKSGGGGTVLTMETIRIIRDLHRDFNTPSFKRKAVAAQSALSRPTPTPPHLQHSILNEGCTEVCVKTRSHGWVIGRRATQSHREFFLLLEDKIGNLAEIQGQIRMCICLRALGVAPAAARLTREWKQGLISFSFCVSVWTVASLPSVI